MAGGPPLGARLPTFETTLTGWELSSVETVTEFPPKTSPGHDARVRLRDDSAEAEASCCLERIPGIGSERCRKNSRGFLRFERMSLHSQ